MSERDEIAKWLRLGYETYGAAGVRAVADAMGLDRSDAQYAAHDDQHVSPNHRSRATEVDGSPTVRLYFWEPAGKGESSFGHLSSSVCDTMYSWGPGGMTIEPREAYLRRNRFRGALERTLRLTPEEKQLFEKSLHDYGADHEYSIFNANCADPTEEALEQLGYPIGVRLTPKDVQDAVVATRLSDPDGYTYRKVQGGNIGDKRSLGKRVWDAIPAPWSPLFAP